MKTSRPHALAVPVLIGALAAAGCDRAPPGPTAISYRQVAICKNYLNAGGPATAAAGEAFAIFKIETIINTKAANSFHLDPSRIYVDQPTPAQGKANAFTRHPALAPDFAPPGAPKAPEGPVPKGEMIDQNIFAVVSIETGNPGGGPEDQRFDLQLLYDDRPSDAQSYREGFVSRILMIKTNPPGSTYAPIETCKADALN